MATVSSGSTEIAFQVTGEGPAVLLMAGTGYPGATWPPSLIEALAPMFTTIVYDHRGTGASPGTPEAYTTRLFAADAAAVLQVVGAGPAHLIGHSMGGRVAQWLAFDKPDLVRSMVLAASGPGYGWQDGQTGNGVPVATVVELVERGYEGYIRERQRRTFFTDEFSRTHPEVVQWLGDAFWRNRPTLEDYLKHVIARQSHDATDILGHLHQPALIIVGELDTHQGDTGSHLDQAHYLESHLPRARLEILPALRHGFFWQAPQASAEAAIRRLTNVEHEVAGR